MSSYFSRVINVYMRASCCSWSKVSRPPTDRSDAVNGSCWPKGAALQPTDDISVVLHAKSRCILFKWDCGVVLFYSLKCLKTFIPPIRKHLKPFVTKLSGWILSWCASSVDALQLYCQPFLCLILYGFCKKKKKVSADGLCVFFPHSISLGINHNSKPASVRCN